MREVFAYIARCIAPAAAHINALVAAEELHFGIGGHHHLEEPAVDAFAQQHIAIGKPLCAAEDLGEVLAADGNGQPVLAIRRLPDQLAVARIDFDSAQRAAAIRWKLEKAGNKIGPYDLQIAAQAMAFGATLISHNVREFSRVEGLALEDWEVGAV